MTRTPTANHTKIKHGDLNLWNQFPHNPLCKDKQRMANHINEKHDLNIIPGIPGRDVTDTPFPKLHGWTSCNDVLLSVQNASVAVSLEKVFPLSETHSNEKCFMLFHTPHNFRFEACATYFPRNIYPLVILQVFIHRSLRS